MFTKASSGTWWWWGCKANPKYIYFGGSPPLITQVITWEFALRLCRLTQGMNHQEQTILCKLVRNGSCKFNLCNFAMHSSWTSQSIHNLCSWTRYWGMRCAHTWISIDFMWPSTRENDGTYVGMKMKAFKKTAAWTTFHWHERTAVIKYTVCLQC